MVQNVRFAVGSLVAVRHSIDVYCSLGLVVDQLAGLRWLERDPCLQYCPKSGMEHEFVLVRWLGLKLTEYGPSGKKSLPQSEPNEIETVRWGYAQLNQSWVVAGPDVDSIYAFRSQCRTFKSLLGVDDIPFAHDVDLLAEYLLGTKRSKEETSFYDRMFFAMLRDVLPTV